MIYLDNAATTRVFKEVSDEIAKSLQTEFANPSSLYSIGATAEFEIFKSRKILANALNCTESEIYFSSCASESNNILIYGLALARKNRGKKIILTGYEHPSVTKPFEFLKEEGFEVVVINPRKDGNIDLEDIINSIDKNTILVSAMFVNNETGAKIDIETLSKKIKEKNPLTAFHSDIVQGFLKYKIDTSKIKVDALSFSGHKVNAPKGVGGFYLKKGVNIRPVFIGGNQEKGLRAGTENIHYIKGFSKSVSIHHKNMMVEIKKYTQLKEYLLKRLEDFDNIIINSPENAAPYIVNFAFLGYKSETLLHFLEKEEVYISSGSSCSKGAKSHTLTAMKLDDEIIDSSIRVSFDTNTQMSDIDVLITSLENAKNKLQKIKLKITL